LAHEFCGRCTDPSRSFLDGKRDFTKSLNGIGVQQYMGIGFSDKAECFLIGSKAPVS
jgi:hypothetical protein